MLSTASAQNNFLDDGNTAKLSKNVSIRNLAPDIETSWVPDRPTGDDFLPPPNGGPGPVMSPTNRPYVPNGNGRQPTYRIADTTNPILSGNTVTNGSQVPDRRGQLGCTDQALKMKRVPV